MTEKYESLAIDNDGRGNERQAECMKGREEKESKKVSGPWPTKLTMCLASCARSCIYAEQRSRIYTWKHIARNPNPGSLESNKFLPTNRETTLRLRAEYGIAIRYEAAPPLTSSGDAIGCRRTVRECGCGLSDRLAKPSCRTRQPSRRND